jgi:MSHA pilin protein MshD
MSRLFRKQSGISMIELIIFIVIVSVGIAGILSVMDVTVRASADPLVRKQAVSIAESVMEEIQLQPFTYCDPDDAATETATSTGDCTVVQGLTPNGETRLGNPPFDNVGDYNGSSPVGNINGVSVPGYAATVTITQVGTAVFGLADNSAALQIDVNVTGADTDISLTGYRLRYAPNAGP